MITRMEITYRSKKPCSIKPEIFTTGGYEISKDNVILNFDFEEMTASCRFENGYLYIDALQKNFDESLLNGISLESADRLLTTSKKEDFTEIYYECFADLKETEAVELIPLEIEFADFSASGDGLPKKVLGNAFCNLSQGASPKSSIDRNITNCLLAHNEYGDETLCEWCKNIKDEREVVKTDLGNLCDSCIRAIKSRGESVTIY